jgi:hypothetical protein
MANPEHLEILKQGVEIWNEWREQNPTIKPNLSGADLRAANLNQAILDNTILKEADLREAGLSYARLLKANLFRANLERAGLFMANLKEADLGEANLCGAFLSNADLYEANLTKAELREADLTKAELRVANLRGAGLFNTTWEDAQLAGTVIAYVDLSATIGIEKILHLGPSEVSTSTIQRSKGHIPEVFLRGCGLSDLDIEYSKLYNPALSNNEIDEILYKIHDLRVQHSLQISPIFISYSHGDGEFVDRIGEHLNQKGVRFWRDVHHATAGRLEKQIDMAIRRNPTVLVILSENSTKSDWVEHEVRTARNLEKELGRDVLCPVALDDSWKTARWPARIMEQLTEYNILDFLDWEDDDKFSRQFRKLIDGLDIFYK